MVLVTFAAVVALAVPLAVASARVYREREVGRLEQLATRAEGSLPTSAIRVGAQVRLPPHPPKTQLAVYDRSGVLIAGEGPATGGSVVLNAISGRVNNDHDGAWLAVAVPIHDETVVVGAARSAARWHVVASSTYASWALIAAFGALAVAIAGALAIWQSRRLVRPIDDVALMAVRLGEGDFGARVDQTGVRELDRAATALNRTAERLAEIMGRERALTADVSHQLNTPLTSLRLGLESAGLDGSVTPEEAITGALVEVDRLEATVTTLLRVAKDRMDSCDARCDVTVVGKAEADRYRSQLAGQGRRLDLALDTALPLVRCPANVLREILAVLLENALQHGVGTVSVVGRRAGSGVVIDVSDEGPGLSDPAAVFVRHSAQANGTGIGLALARSLAEAHQARLLLTGTSPHPVFTLALSGSD